MCVCVFVFVVVLCLILQHTTQACVCFYCFVFDSMAYYTGVLFLLFCV